MAKLHVLEGGKNKLMSHIYEVHDSEGHIVDILRFSTPEDAAEFQSGIIGEYYVRPHTLTAEELLDVVLDIRMDDLLDEE